MEQTLGAKIAQLRKQQGMTQQALADRMGVTDKAVSKWERDLSCPDIKSVPALAEVLGVSVEELMQTEKKTVIPKGNAERILETVLKGVAAAMGIAVAVLSFLGALEVEAGMGMLGIGLACAGLSLMNGKNG